MVTDVNVLEVVNAHKRYGDTQALAGAEFSLKRGDWLALLGPNGAGKTTLVRAVAGRVRLDEGTIALNGRRLDGSPAARAARGKLGVVTQEIALYPLLTPRENLTAFACFCGVSASDRDERTRWALEWTCLQDRADQPVDQLSGGMKRRLNIACSVLHEPDVILLDEPTVGVDPQSRERIWEMLEELRSQGASLLLTTHQLDEAQQVARRIVIIDHGRTVAEGTYNQLLQQTIGTKRRVSFQIDRPVSELHIDNDVEILGEATIGIGVEDVAAELPTVLERLSAAGVQIKDLSIQSPSLQAVFIHLTGRDLRE